MSDTLTLAETARFLGYSERTLRRRRAQGHAPQAIRRGRRKLLLRSDIESWAGPHLAPRVDGLTGIPGPLLTPGSPEWMAVMTASKVASVVRLSPYESRAALWLRMHGDAPQVEQSDEMSRGHLLEPAVAAWWAGQHPDCEVVTTGTWVNPDARWQAASPDRLARQADGTTVLVECKSAADDAEWGRGLDEVPIGYRCQAQWQMHVTGARWCWIAVILPRLEFREYLVEYAPAEADALVAASRAFLDDLAAGRRPELDGDQSTYDAIRAAHPDIDRDLDVDLDPELAGHYLTTHLAEKAAVTRHRAAKTAVLDVMGQARRALDPGGNTVATRQPNGTHPPKLIAAPAAVKATAAHTQETA